MIPHTHGFDLLHRLLLVVGTILLLFVGGDFLSPGLTALEAWGTRVGYSGGITLLEIVIFFVGLYTAFWTLKRTILPGWPFTWAYARLAARVRLTIDEAERLTPFVDGSCSGRWISLGRVRRLDPSERRAGLFFMANRFAEAWKHSIPFPDLDEAIRRAEQEEKRREREAAADENARKRAEGSKRSESAEDEHSQGGAEFHGSGFDPIAHALRVLGFTGTKPDFEQIRHAYRKKIADYHPDRFEGKDEALRKFVEERSKAINAAYQLLERAYTVNK